MSLSITEGLLNFAESRIFVRISGNEMMLPLSIKELMFQRFQAKAILRLPAQSNTRLRRSE